MVGDRRIGENVVPAKPASLKETASKNVLKNAKCVRV